MIKEKYKQLGLDHLFAEINTMMFTETLCRHPKKIVQTKTIDNLDSKTERKRFKNSKFA